jgi:hypothetical protein
LQSHISTEGCSRRRARRPRRGEAKEEIPCKGIDSVLWTEDCRLIFPQKAAADDEEAGDAEEKPKRKRAVAKTPAEKQEKAPPKKKASKKKKVRLIMFFQAISGY